MSFFASTTLGGTVEGLNMGKQFGIQAFAAVGAAVYTLIVSFIILKVIDLVSGLRVDEDTETDGLDVSEHGETGYDL